MDMKYDIQPKYMAVALRFSIHFSSIVPITTYHVSEISGQRDLLYYF